MNLFSVDARPLWSPGARGVGALLTQARLEKAATSGDPARVINIGSIDGVHIPP